MVEYFSPSDVADRTGFSLDTLRYYERIGLLTDVSRDSGGRRRFDSGHVAWLEMLRYLRDTGMPISQLQRYTELAQAGESTIPERMALLADHERLVADRIAGLRRQHQRIRQKIGWYREYLATANKTSA